MSLTPVRISTRFKKQLHKKPVEMQDAIIEAVTQLRKDHTHKGLHTHRVWGQPGVFEARIDKANRLTFHWDGPTIVLRAHCNHDILKRP